LYHRIYAEHKSVLQNQNVQATVHKDSDESKPSSIYGFGLGVDEKPPPVDVNTASLLESFNSGFAKYGDLWKKIIPLPEFTEISKYRKIKQVDRFYYPSTLWARILFNFAIAYRNNNIDQSELINAMIPFYHSRVLSYVNKTKGMETREAEEYLENITRIFESEKYYLIQRWTERAGEDRFF